MTPNIANLAAVRCAWVTPVLGVDGGLLYLGPLFRTLAPCFHSFVVVTGEFVGDSADAGFSVELCGRFRRMYANERATTKQIRGYRSGIGFATPTVLLRFIRKPLDLLIITEFSLYACYAALATLFVDRTRVLWVVEARPRHSSSRLLGIARVMSRRLLAKLADAFLTNNRDGSDYIVEVLGVDPARVLVHPFTVSDVSGASGQQLPRTVVHGEVIRFLYVGQLIRRKGIRVALEAARRVHERTAVPFGLEIVGDGPDRGELERFAASQGIAHLTTFRGRVSYAELPALYRAAHVFVFPTFSDYRALTPFEALSSGLPIIASRNDGGVGETVDEGRNGFSFDPQNPAELAAHMEYFIRNPDTVAAFSLRSIEMAKRYTLEAAVSALQIAAITALGNSPRPTHGQTV
jgi:glycosyltransferase involved in cell wall biosynthesis